MKITDYEKKKSLVDSNVFLIDGPDGTKTILAKDAANALLALLSSKELVANLNMSQLNQSSIMDATNRIMIGTDDGIKGITASDILYAIIDSSAGFAGRRNFFRGKSLGTAYTAEQKAAVKNGTFKGLFLGDYWEIGGHIWRIVDFNYWKNFGDVATTVNHLVIMPDHLLYNTVMNDTDTTSGGYIGSKMRAEGLNNAKTLVNSAFGEGNILNHRNSFSNAITGNDVTGYAWVDSYIEIPNQIMIFGSSDKDSANSEGGATADVTQLAAMNVNYNFLNSFRETYWLRNVMNSERYLVSGLRGSVEGIKASLSRGVRPVFGITGD